MSRASGNLFEDQACAFLQAQGLSLLARNWSCRFGEIDLIMQDGKYRVFVEVRAAAATSMVVPPPASARPSAANCRLRPTFT